MSSKARFQWTDETLRKHEDLVARNRQSKRPSKWDTESGWQPTPPHPDDLEAARDVLLFLPKDQTATIYAKFRQLQQMGELSDAEACLHFAGQASKAVAPSSLMVYLTQIKSAATADGRPLRGEAAFTLNKLIKAADIRASQMRGTAVTAIDEDFLLTVLRRAEDFAPRAAEALWTIATAGLRASDVTLLTRESIQLTPDGCYLTVPSAKNIQSAAHRQLRSVAAESPLSQARPDTMMGYLDAIEDPHMCPYRDFPAAVLNRVLREVIEAGEPILTSYSSRKSLAESVMCDTGDLKAVSRALGHREDGVAQGFYVEWNPRTIAAHESRASRPTRHKRPSDTLVFTHGLGQTMIFSLGRFQCPQIRCRWTESIAPAHARFI